MLYKFFKYFIQYFIIFLQRDSFWLGKKTKRVEKKLRNRDSEAV
jgi:hypothetical protein